MNILPNTDNLLLVFKHNPFANIEPLDIPFFENTLPKSPSCLSLLSKPPWFLLNGLK